MSEAATSAHDIPARFWRDRRGAVAAAVAALLPVLVGFAEIAVEIGLWFAVQRQNQSAADAAAISQSQAIPRPRKRLERQQFRAKPRNRPGLGDRGAVAIEFALVFPVLMLMFAGVFGVGAVMIQYMQLYYVVQGAAQKEAKTGSGAPWASSQLPSAAFVANPTAPCGAQITGHWPVSLGVLPTLTLSAQACWPN